MTLKTLLKVPADPIWRHVVATTVLAAVRGSGSVGTAADADARFGLGKMGDVSVLLDRAVGNIDQLAGVQTLMIEVAATPDSVLITVVGQGDDVELPAWMGPANSLSDPITGSAYHWTPTAITCTVTVS